MEQLHNAIKNLDKGEPVNEFWDETRRVVYCDRGSRRYFTKDGNKKRYLGLEDITSDYAWDIKYVPDREMEESVYRTLAKRILTNETRRNIEQLYDRELSKKGQGLTTKQDLTHIEQQWKKWEHGSQKEGVMIIGQVAETAVRELLNRVALNNKLDFAVLRVSAVEDSIYKYDFKIRIHQRNRG